MVPSGVESEIFQESLVSESNQMPCLFAWADITLSLGDIWAIRLYEKNVIQLTRISSVVEW